MKKILIADDYVHIYETISRVLKKNNIPNEIVCVDNGGAVLELLKNDNQFGVILIDESMRAHDDGLHTVKEIREIGAYQNTPVFILAGVETTRIRTRANQAGATGVLSKMSLNNIKDAVIAALKDFESG